MQLEVEKNEEKTLPVPHVWRPIFSAIVKSFVKKDYKLAYRINHVKPVSLNTANQIREYIEDYGEELIELPEEAWDTSVYIYCGDYWSVLIDLYTKTEGQSDLVLELEVREANKEYVVDIKLVYVP